MRPRSGSAIKQGITLPQYPRHDRQRDYRGEVKVILINHGQEPFPIRRGEPHRATRARAVLRASFVEVEQLGETARGAGGFGLDRQPWLLSDDELDRYARHIVLPQVGGAGQQRLKDASIAVVGAGGSARACFRPWPGPALAI